MPIWKEDRPHPPMAMLVLPKYLLDAVGFEALKDSADRLGLRGFIVTDGRNRAPIAKYVRGGE